MRYLFVDDIFYSYLRSRKKIDRRDIERAQDLEGPSFVIVRRAGPALLTAFQYFISFQGGRGRGTQVLLDERSG